MHMRERSLQGCSREHRSQQRRRKPLPHSFQV
jgi:hypothetical protein